MEALLAVAEEHGVEDGPLIDEDFKTIKEDDDRTKIKSSQYRGVCYVKKSDKWTASISVENKRVQLGYFTTQEEAAMAYDAAATAHHPHPILNFIDGVINPDRLINKDANHRHSTFTGVTFIATRKRWMAQIYLHTADGRKKKHLGLFPDELSAAEAYDRAAREYYDRPVTNFLPDGSLNPDRFIGQKKTAGLARVPAGDHPSLTPMIKYDRVTRPNPHDDEDEEAEEYEREDGRGLRRSAAPAARGVKEEDGEEGGGKRRSTRKRTVKKYSDAASDDDAGDDSPPPPDHSDDEGRLQSRRKRGKKAT